MYVYILHESNLSKDKQINKQYTNKKIQSNII